MMRVRPRDTLIGATQGISVKGLGFKHLSYDFLGNRRRDGLVRITLKLCAAVFVIYSVSFRLDV